jgi:DNA (cytosine-5)-methyltransferase 1
LQTNGKKVTKVTGGNGLNELALFAGAGGGILGGHLLGWRTVCAVEWESYPASVLLARQNDGILPPFPIWDDVQTFDGNAWRGIVDVVSGGFPCQDISAAGKGAGIDGERSGMWKEMARVICEVRPKFVFVENSPMLTHRGLDRVLANLANMGFDAEWGVLGASDIGAKHHRKRIWIVARQREIFSYSNDRQFGGQQQQESHAETGGNMANTDNTIRRGQRWGFGSDKNSQSQWNLHTIFNQPEPLRVADGVAARVDRLKAIGNGQVPQVAAVAWQLLMERLDERV